jgi:hypothetical protein
LRVIRQTPASHSGPAAADVPQTNGRITASRIQTRVLATVSGCRCDLGGWSVGWDRKPGTQFAVLESGVRGDPLPPLFTANATICLFDNPAAHANTIRDRNANTCADLARRGPPLELVVLGGAKQQIRRATRPFAVDQPAHT